MPKINPGDCVQILDGRIGRIRKKSEDGISKVRVRRKNGDSHQFLIVKNKELKKVKCPKGWMSPEGYNNYLKVTLHKLRDRLRQKKNKI